RRVPHARAGDAEATVKRRLNGEGTVYEERDPRRRTTHRAEIDVTLANGAVHRVIARGVGAQDARRKLESKAKRLRNAHPDAESLTLRQYLEQWLDFKKPRVRASTLATYRRDVAHIVKRVGGTKLSRFTPRDAQELI